MYTLADLLPPPLDDTPEALLARNHAAIAKVAALLPVNANEIDLAAQCISARVQAEEMLRQVRQNPGDLGLVLRLSAQHGSMVRTSLAVHGRLMRVQAVRQKREAIEGAATEDARTGHVAQRSMLKVVDPDAGQLDATRLGAAPVTGLAAFKEQNASNGGANSHGVAFETSVSEPPWNRAARGSGETAVGKAMTGSVFALSRSRGRELPATRRERPGGAGTETASISLR